MMIMMIMAKYYRQNGIIHQYVDTKYGVSLRYVSQNEYQPQNKYQLW